MVHYVPDEGIDDGPVIDQQLVQIELTDTLETLTARIHETEHASIIASLAQLSAHKKEKNTGE